MSDEVAEVLAELSEYLKLDGQSGQARMYSRAADNVRTAEHIPPDPAEIDGIGEALREDVAEIQYSGTLERLEKLKEKHSYYEAFRGIEGVGPVTARRLGDAGIETKPQLEDAINSGRVLEVDGIGQKTAEKIERKL